VHPKKLCYACHCQQQYIVLDEKVRLPFFNDILNLFGLDVNDVKNIPRLDLHHKDDRDRCTKAILVEALENVATV
jgi:hypothetical protein